MSNRRVFINYTTFARDVEWLDYSLQSFRRHCSGFSGVTIVVPDRDLHLFIKFEKRYGTPECPVLIKNFMEYPGKGFVHHLAMKCYADVFSPQATHILHMDPDCVWIKATTPDDYFIGEKPVLVIEPYEEIKKYHEARWNWKKITEETLRFECKYETMCRHPAVHHSWLYQRLRSYIESIHPTPFVDYVLKQRNVFPQGFGEFNTLGSYVVKEHELDYHLWDRKGGGEEADPDPHISQMWSYTGANAPKNQEIIRNALK
jgi:hypothetical protein